MKAWSFSKINVFEECPRQFKYKYLDNLTGAIKSDAMAVGSGIHDFLEFYSMNHAASLEDCQAVYAKTVASQSCLINHSAIDSYIPLVKWYMSSGKVLTPYRSPNNDKPLTEKWFKLDCGHGVQCNGKIDIVTENHCVVDYKTAKDTYTQKQTDEALKGSGLQLTIYAAAYHQWFDKLPEKVGFQVLLKDMSEIQNVGSTRTKEDIDKAKEIVRNIDTRYKYMVEAKSFPKGLDAKCFWCNFRDKCRQEL